MDHMRTIVLLGIMMSQLGPDQTDAEAVDLANRAARKLVAAELGEAEALFGRAFTIWEQNGKVTLEWAFALANLGTLQTTRAEFDKAQASFRKSFEMLDLLIEPEDPRRARVLLALANTHLAMNETREARRLLVQALRICAANREELSSAAAILGRIAEAEGKMPSAERWFRLALTLRVEALGPHHPETAKIRCNLGVVLRLRGKLDEAESHYAAALKDLDSVYEYPHPAQAMLVNNLGQIQQERRRWKEAQNSYETAAHLLRASLGPDHPSIANVLTNLASLHQSRKRYSQAESFLKEALRIERRHYPLSHPRVAMTYNNLAALAAARKNYAEAETMLQGSLESLRAGLPEGHQDIGLVAVNLGEVYRATRQYERATPLFKEGLRTLERAWGPDDPRLAPKLERYSALMRAQQEYAEAERAQVRFFAIQVKQALR